MKMKLMLGLVALAGLAAAFAIASPSQANGGHHGKGGTTTGATTGTTTGTTTGEHHHGSSSCQRVQLAGSNGSGSVAFTVSRANHNGASLVGKQVTLTVPAGSSVGATACLDAAGTLTLRGLVIRQPKPTPAATTNTTTTNGPRSHKSHK